MPLLRFRLSPYPETAQDFELAAEARYWEGLELMAADRPFAGVYLMGYSAEMFLKLACFRLAPLVHLDPIGPRLGPVRRWMAQHRPQIDPERYHSLIFWASYLRERRRFLGRPLPRPLDSTLLQRAHRLYGLWWVEMRYRPGGIHPHEVRSAYDDASWLRNHYTLLWR